MVVGEDEMAKVFFTYVWGPPGDPCWPLTFGSKAARTLAKKALSEGDHVFTVGTRGEPTSSDFRGRVLGLYQVSSLEVNTVDYINQIETSGITERAASEFPYALHPISVWEITSPENIFSRIVGHDRAASDGQFAQLVRSDGVNMRYQNAIVQETG